MTLSEFYLSRVGVVGSVFAAAVTQVCAVFMPPAVAAQSIGVGPCRGEACGEMLESMVRIAPSQPNEAMARIAPRSPMISIANKKKSLDLCYVTFAAIYLSRAGVVGNVFAAALTQV